MVVDRSVHGDLLRVNFNISFPALPCEFASLDISDALGTVRLRHWLNCQTHCLTPMHKGHAWHAVLGSSAWSEQLGQVASHMLCCLQKKINLTKTVRKLPINDQLERAGHYLYDDRQLEIKYDDPAVRPLPCVLSGACRVHL